MIMNLLARGKINICLDEILVFCSSRYKELIYASTDEPLALNIGFGTVSRKCWRKVSWFLRTESINWELLDPFWKISSCSWNFPRCTGCCGWKAKWQGIPSLRWLLGIVVTNITPDTTKMMVTVTVTGYWDPYLEKPSILQNGHQLHSIDTILILQYQNQQDGDLHSQARAENELTGG